MATSERCPECGARNWVIYREGGPRDLTIRCSDCDEVLAEVRELDPRTGQVCDG